MLSSIDLKDTSLAIVFQGIIDCKSVERIINFKKVTGLTVYVSTWNDTDLSLVNKLTNSNITVFLSFDPGCFDIIIEGVNQKNNTKRQIVGTLSGLYGVREEITLKLRTDCLITCSGIRAILAAFKSVAKEQTQFFKSKIVATNVTTLTGRTSHLYYHVCDWMLLGRTEDLIKKFHIRNLIEDSLICSNDKEVKTDEKISRFRQETALTYLALEPNKGLSRYEYSGQKSLEILKESLNHIRSEYYIIDFWRIGLRNYKYPYYRFWYVSDRYYEYMNVSVNLKIKILSKFFSYFYSLLKFRKLFI